MKFVTLKSGETVDLSARDVMFLAYNDWDDWFEFETKHILWYVDKDGQRHRIGAVKIGKKGQKERRPELPRTFSELGKNFFSIGQDEDYYNLLRALGVHDEALRGLRDMAYLPSVFEKFKSERVSDISLFRSVPEDRVSNRFRRLANGDVELSYYRFSYTFPEKFSAREDALEISFEVTPYSNPPSNVHVLIGRNGVGKTTCMTHMIKSILDIQDDDPGSFEVQSENGSAEISNVISVTFSAFDPSFPPEKKYKDEYAYIGLKRKATKVEKELYDDAGMELPDYFLKNLDDLKSEFVKTAQRCRKGVKRERWKSALDALSADPLFAESEVLDLVEDEFHDDEDWKYEAELIFDGLSSGHKVVLLTISRLVELVQEQSLVLLDEPEGHLHPPLLSAFVRALSSLLKNQNGVALIATHSPVVLQEVPRNCVWILDRAGRTIDAQRPSLETFGESVGQLTHEVFGLEVTDTGFYRMVREAMLEDGDLDSLSEHFGGKLGSEAIAVASALAYDPSGEWLNEKPA